MAKEQLQNHPDTDSDDDASYDVQSLIIDSDDDDLYDVQSLMKNHDVSFEQVQEIYERSPKELKAVANLNVQSLMKNYGVSFQQVLESYARSPDELKAFESYEVRSLMKDHGVSFQQVQEIYARSSEELDAVANQNVQFLMKDHRVSLQQVQEIYARSSEELHAVANQNVQFLMKHHGVSFQQVQLLYATGSLTRISDSESITRPSREVLNDIAIELRAKNQRKMIQRKWRNFVTNQKVTEPLDAALKNAISDDNIAAFRSAILNNVIIEVNNNFNGETSIMVINARDYYQYLMRIIFDVDDMGKIKGNYKKENYNENLITIRVKSKLLAFDKDLQLVMTQASSATIPQVTPQQQQIFDKLYQADMDFAGSKFEELASEFAESKASRPTNKKIKSDCHVSRLLEQHGSIDKTSSYQGL